MTTWHFSELYSQGVKIGENESIQWFFNLFFFSHSNFNTACFLIYSLALLAKETAFVLLNFHFDLNMVKKASLVLSKKKKKSAPFLVQWSILDSWCQTLVTFALMVWADGCSVQPGVRVNGSSPLAKQESQNLSISSPSPSWFGALALWLNVGRWDHTLMLTSLICALGLVTVRTLGKAGSLACTLGTLEPGNPSSQSKLVQQGFQTSPTPLLCVPGILLKKIFSANQTFGATYREGSPFNSVVEK